jgi:hypothetical protein
VWTIHIFLVGFSLWTIMPFLAITRQMDGPAIAERFKRAATEHNTSSTSLAFFQVNFDHAIASAVIDMMRHSSSQPQPGNRGRLQWNELCFFHCRCDGVNGEEEGEEEENPRQEERIDETATDISVATTLATTRRRNMDCIVQVAMACDIFRQLTIKGPAGDDNNNIQNQNNDNNNQGGQQEPHQHHQHQQQAQDREGDEVFGYFAFQSIGMGLSFNRKFKKLQFSHLSLSGIQAAALSQGLGMPTCSLEQLVFTRVSFATGTANGDNLQQQGEEEDAIAALAKGLAQNLSLDTLALTSCKLNDTQVACLVTALQNHPTLTVLRLFGNECRAKGAQALANLLSSPSSCLESLDLHHQQQSRPPLRHLRLMQLLQQQRVQQEENFGRQQRQQLIGRFLLLRRGAGGGNPAGDGEQESETTTSTLAQQNRLPVELLAAGLRGNQSLRRLNLGSNQLGDNDMASLGRVLWTCPRLESLELEHNDIGVDGLEKFAMSHRASHLKSLRLQGNPRLTSSGRGPSLLVKILQVHPTIEAIDRHAFWTRSVFGPLIQHWMDFNRGGRRALCGSSCSTNHCGSLSPALPLGLWPKVLERANREFCRLVDRQANVLFHLLKGPVLFEQGNSTKMRDSDLGNESTRTVSDADINNVGSAGRKRKREELLDT